MFTVVGSAVGIPVEHGQRDAVPLIHDAVQFSPLPSAPSIVVSIVGAAAVVVWQFVIGGFLV